MTITESRTAELSAVNQPMKLEGYAIVFDSPAVIGNTREVIKRGALDNCDLSDVSLFVNHDSYKIPLARTPNTLILEVDNRGLKFTAELPATDEGKALYEAVKRGDLRGCSFAFNVAEGGDVTEGNVRTINSIEKIFECSVVTYPAYDETSVEARQKEQKEGNKMDNQTMGTNARALYGVGSFQPDNAMAIANLDGDNVLSSAEYRSAFFKTLQGKILTRAEETAFKIARDNFEKRANEFSTSTNSAAMIPTATLDEIISKAHKEGGLLAECRSFNLPSKIAIPVSTPADKASWHVEGAAVESEKITPTTVTFDGNEIIKIFSISTKIQTMAINSFESYLVNELEQSVMATIADALVNGTGTGQGTGLMTAFNSDNTVTPSTGSSISYSDVVKTVAKLKRGYSNGAKWAMNNATLWTVFYNMTDTSKRPIFIADTQNESIGKILGYPVVVDDNIADDTIIFGNFQYMGYNLPSGIVIENSRESSFKSALIDYRALAIADCKPIIAEAFVKLSA